jgi:cytochrome c nitrite reductase small subunit
MRHPFRIFLTRRFLLAGLVGLGAVIGIAAGLGGYTFIYARGNSYLTNDPKACINCHVMDDYYNAWTKGSHHQAAACNDCHAPHAFVGKWMTKGINGWNHSLAFTTQRFHEPIQISPRNRAITENQCRQCHQPIVQMIDHGSTGKDRLDCLRCHSTVGHDK